MFMKSRILLSSAVCHGIFSLVSAASAAIVAAYEFNTDTDQEGWVAPPSLNTSGLTATGGFLSGVASSNDPQLVNNTASITIGSGQTWDRIEFRVRENQNEVPVGPLTTFNPTGLIININNAGGTTPPSVGLLVSSPASFTAVDSGDNFYTVTIGISGFTGSTISSLRLDPIGGAASNSNSETNGNAFEVDFIRVHAIPEPSAFLLGGLGLTALLRRRR
jgi:hypothetical protein